MDIYKNFRITKRLWEQNSISKRHDEPTYLSFRLQFASNMDNVYNIATNATANFDTMPHPLFDIKSYSGNNTGFAGEQSYEIEPGSYSAYDYLINANEPARAELLIDFINKFNILQRDFPYYFQSISGIGDLLKIDTKKGQRIPKDTKLTITCLEGLDLRMSYLLNLYRKIAWDDVYQRWILPDMMRYFTLKIFISEFRVFHTPSNGNTTNSENNNLTGVSVNNSNKSVPLYLSVLDDVLPTWEIQCEMCEFDINDIEYSYINDMNVGSTPEMASIKFSIKVGNIKELQIYPAFKYMFLSDRQLNGPNRLKSGAEHSSISNANNKYEYPTSLLIAQSREGDEANTYHESGTSYNQMENSYALFGQSGPGANNVWGKEDAVEVNSTQNETWIGNAITWGKGFATNVINKTIDKAKITKIDALGLSYTEITTALQSKNVIAAMGMIRKGVNDVVQSYENGPSSKLDQPIETDNILKEFLETLTISDATDDDTLMLKTIANQVLSDNKMWQQIKDYSMATNLIGINETNTFKDIEGKTTLSDLYKKESINKNELISTNPINNVLPNAVSKKLDNIEIIEFTPSSLYKNVNLEKIEQPIASKATNSKI
jgi:hypothetical protein